MRPGHGQRPPKLEIDEIKRERRFPVIIVDSKNNIEVDIEFVTSTLESEVRINFD